MKERRRKSKCTYPKKQIEKENDASQGPKASSAGRWWCHHKLPTTTTVQQQMEGMKGLDKNASLGLSLSLSSMKGREKTDERGILCVPFSSLTFPSLPNSFTSNSSLRIRTLEGSASLTEYLLIYIIKASLYPHFVESHFLPIN